MGRIGNPDPRARSPSDCKVTDATLPPARQGQALVKAFSWQLFHFEAYATNSRSCASRSNPAVHRHRGASITASLRKCLRSSEQ